MSKTYVIEDDWHAEWSGEYSSYDDAFAELRRRAESPWDEPPNQAPCMSWQTCGRAYWIIEFASKEEPWEVLNRIWIFNISAEGVTWNPET